MDALNFQTLKNFFFVNHKDKGDELVPSRIYINSSTT